MGTAMFVQYWHLLLVGGVSGHCPSRCEQVAPGFAAGKFLAGNFGVAAGFSVASRAVGWPKILAGPAGSQRVCSQRKLGRELGISALTGRTFGRRDWHGQTCLECLVF